MPGFAVDGDRFKGVERLAQQWHPHQFALYHPGLSRENQKLSQCFPGRLVFPIDDSILLRDVFPSLHAVIEPAEMLQHEELPAHPVDRDPVAKTLAESER